MSHAFGDAPELDDDVRTAGGNTGRLIYVEVEYDPYTGMPRMSNIPVRIELFDRRAVGARDVLGRLAIAQECSPLT
jgi:hypothetical protein